MEIDSDPDHPARRDKTCVTCAQDVAISVPMHEQLFYLVGFHYSFDFLEVNIFFQLQFTLLILWINFNEKFSFQSFLNDFYDKITVGETERANEGFEYRDEDGTSIFVIQFDRYWNGCAIHNHFILKIVSVHFLCECIK